MVEQMRQNPNLRSAGFLNTDYIQPYLNNKIGEYQNVQIYKLSSP